MGTNGLRRHARDGHRITAASVFCLLAAGWLATDIRGADLTRVYEDDRIRVPVPAGWTAKQETVTATGDQTLVIPIGGVLSTGKYRLYLLTHHGQVSGIIGGRFGEIAQYVAPWMPVHDPGGCFGDFATTVTPVTQQFARVDLVLAPKLARKNQDPDCASLGRLVKRPVWAGAYFGSPVPGARFLGYFLSFPLGNDRAMPDHEMAFTATIDATTAANLPAKTDPALQAFLRQTSAILGSIAYK